MARIEKVWIGHCGHPAMACEPGLIIGKDRSANEYETQNRY
jgi:hypothetical protein